MSLPHQRWTSAAACGLLAMVAAGCTTSGVVGVEDNSDALVNDAGSPGDASAAPQDAELPREDGPGELDAGRDADAATADAEVDAGGDADAGEIPDTPLPQFPGGAPNSGPLVPGAGPDTAVLCTPPTQSQLPESGPAPELGGACYFSEADSEVPAAVIEYVVEEIRGVPMLHVRLTYSPAFVDNTFGDTAVGWEGVDKGHEFRDLVGSDRAEIFFADADGTLVLQVKVDYVSNVPEEPSGYGTLGVEGGRGAGEVKVGDKDHVLGAATSLSRNLNGCGYDGYDADSPVTDSAYGTNTEAPNWDYRVVYELWVDLAAFGDAGFGRVYIQSLHASPSKLDQNDLAVDERPCPPVECSLQGGCEPVGAL